MARSLIAALRSPKNLWMTRAVPQDAVPLAEIAAAMETIAPVHLAESWDNVGLLSGHRTSLVKKILLTIDITPAVHDEAIAKNIDLIISYHPPIFKPLKHLRINGDEPPALAVALASFGVWVYSPHTALDTAPGGTNDVLAATLGAEITGSFSHYPAQGTFLKLVTFVPERDVEQVADAVFRAGAGNIGAGAKYSRCSFRNPGTGTFMGGTAANPAVGKRGVYERVPEIRFETILPADAAGDVINALRQFHPYEEPAFDLLKMETPPEQVGLGRYATMAGGAVTLAHLAARGKRALGVPAAQMIGDPKRKISTLALVAGAAGRLGLDSATQPYNCLITGELKHHEQLAYAAAGKAVLMFGHGNTERPILGSVAERLKKILPTLSIARAKMDRDPASFV